MQCPKCQFENREDAKFCKKCGAKLELTCSQCNTSLAPDSLFCDECGFDLLKPVKALTVNYSEPQSYTPKYLANKILTTRSSIEGERKQVTVLFADVANYTSMAENLDPEEVHQIMEGCFKILMDEIHKYEGTINQFTGDGVMALFGAPIAHEDHAQRACRAALAIQNVMSQYGKKIKKDWDKAVNGSGQVLGVVGEAGVGKSRLLLEFRRSLANKNFYYFEGQCLHYADSMAYLPFLDILRSYFDIAEGLREYIIKETIREKLKTVDEESLSVSIPAYQDMLSLKIDDESWNSLEPKQRRERTFESVKNLFICLSKEKPLILAVEDLQWMDKSSEEFLSYFIDSMAQSPILLILLHRPEYIHQWGSKTYYRKIGLDQLTLESSAELVLAMLEGSEIAPELKELILNRSAGNPLFMEEFTHTLLENGSTFQNYALCLSYYEADDLGEARGYAEAALEAAQRNQEKHYEGAMKAFLGSITGRMGIVQSAKAEEMIVQGMDILERLGLKAVIAMCYTFLADFYADTGQKEKALQALKTAEQMGEEMGMKYELNKTRQILAKLQD
jgi:tetratricopeptide (TPR) repeat protein